MLQLPNCKMTFVCGPVASGKTHLIKRWLQEHNRHVVFDSTGEFLEDKTREEIWANPRALYDRVRANPYYFRLVYQPGRDVRCDFTHVLNALWWLERDKLLVCDEFHQICPVEGTTEEVERLLRFARHDKLGFIGASQRIADVHKLFTSACRMNVLFWTQEARDLDAIEARWSCADMVENLRPCIHDDVTGITSQIPQCVVCEKGKRPYVYDFETESAKGCVSSAESADSRTEETEKATNLDQLPDSETEDSPSSGASERVL